MRLVVIKYCIVFLAALSLVCAYADGTVMSGSNDVNNSDRLNKEFSMDSSGESVAEQVLSVPTIDTPSENTHVEADAKDLTLPSSSFDDVLPVEPPLPIAVDVSTDTSTEESEINDITNATADSDIVSGIHPVGDSSGEMDSLLGSGLDLEGLLDQLDAATNEIQALKDERSVLSAAVKEQESAAQLLTDQIAALKGELTAMNSMITQLHVGSEACQNNITTSLESSKEEAQAYQTEKLTLMDKIATAERNASSLAIKAKLERNERTIARLSLENCQLELGGVRSGQLDEIAELKAELAAVKRTREVKCKPCTVQKQGQSQGPLNGECDTSACVNSFVSKYLFFWAEEHQAHDAAIDKGTEGGTKPNAASSAAHASPSTQSKPEIPTSPKPPRSADGQRNLQYEEVLSYVQYGTQVAQIALTWLIAQYFTFIHPVLYRAIAWEIDIVCTAAGMCVKGATMLWVGYLSPMWFNTAWPSLQDLYSQIVPLYMKHGYPLYQAYLEGAVKAAYTYYQTNENWIGYNIEDPAEYIIGRLHYAWYFTALFFSPREMGRNMQGVGHYLQDFVPAVIAQLSSMPPIQAQLGEQCETVVTIGVYLTVALFLYLCRRFIFGVVALLAMLVLSPVLIAVYVVAKLAALFQPRKKSSKRSAGNGGSGRPAGKLPAAGPNSGSGGNLAGASTSSAAQPQLATRNFPMNAPVINPVPGYVSAAQRDLRSHQAGEDPRQLANRRPRSDGPPAGSSIPVPVSYGNSSGSGGVSAPLSRPPLAARSASASSQPPPTYGHSRGGHSEEAALGV